MLFENVDFSMDFEEIASPVVGGKAQIQICDNVLIKEK